MSEFLWKDGKMYGRDVKRCYSRKTGEALGYVELYSTQEYHACGRRMLGDYLTEGQAMDAVVRDLRPWYVRWFS